MYTELKIGDLIDKLEEIKSREGNIEVTWGDGYFAERPLSLMVLEGGRMSHRPRRVCFSKEFRYAYTSKR